jgi:hypothetical protein
MSNRLAFAIGRGSSGGYGSSHRISDLEGDFDANCWLLVLGEYLNDERSRKFLPDGTSLPIIPQLVQCRYLGAVVGRGQDEITAAAQGSEQKDGKNSPHG